MALLSEGAKTVALVLVMLVTGSYNTLTIKLAFQTCAPTWSDAATKAGGHEGCPEGQQKFDKPWTNNIFMFVGEASLLLVYSASRRRAGAARTLHAADGPAAAAAAGASSHAAAEQGLLAAPAQKTPFYVFAIPAFCDVFGTGLAAVGMLYMDSAIWQMLRSSIIIFSAFLSVVFLKRRLQAFHWVATGIVFAGLVTVGLASMSDGSATSTATPEQRVFGIVLVVGAQLCSAFQMVFEEKLLTGRAKTSAKKVVGMEGLWGGLFMVAILTLMSTALPGSDDGHYESTPEALHMVSHSPMLLVLVLTYMCSIAVYNLTGIVVGKRMSAVVRCLVDSCRTVVVWAMNLFIYYFVSKDFGSAWMPHSWMTAVGFLLLILGTLLYNEVLPAPAWLTRADAPSEEEDDSIISRSHTGLDDVLAKLDLTEEEGRTSSSVPEGCARCGA